MNKISAFIRLRNGELTVKAVILSLIDYVDEIVVVNHLSTDNSLAIVKSIDSCKIKCYNYEYEVAKPWTKEAQSVSDDNIHSFVYFSNYAMNLCSHNWILKADCEMVFLPEGMKKILNTRFTKPFLGFGGYDIITPFLRVLGYSGQEPRLWNKHLDGGLKFVKLPGGGEAIWNKSWGYDPVDWSKFPNCEWGPRYESLGIGPYWLHYRKSTKPELEAMLKCLNTVPVDMSHPAEIVKNLHNIFPN